MGLTQAPTAWRLNTPLSNSASSLTQCWHETCSSVKSSGPPPGSEVSHIKKHKFTGLKQAVYCKQQYEFLAIVVWIRGNAACSM